MSASDLPIVAAHELYRFFHAGEDETFALRGVSLSVEPGESSPSSARPGAGSRRCSPVSPGSTSPTAALSRSRANGSPGGRRPIARACAHGGSGSLRQSGNLLEHLTVGENVQLARSIAGGRRRRDRRRRPAGRGRCARSLGARAEHALRWRGRTRRPRGRARERSPLLLADEPTGEVDAGNEQLVLELLAARADARARRAARHAQHAGGARRRPRRAAPGREHRRWVSPSSWRRASAGPTAHGATRVEAVRAATFAIDDADTIAVVGPSGSGKSTLLHLIAGLEQPTTGSIVVAGDRRSRCAAARPDRGRVPGSEPAPATHGGRERRAPGAPRRRHRRRRGPRGARAARGVRRGELAEQLPEEISGGQSQRVGFARAFAGSPRLVLADEPTGQLDRDRRRGGDDGGARAHRASRGAALVVATHDAAIAERLDTRWVMRDGDAAPGGGPMLGLTWLAGLLRRRRRTRWSRRRPPWPWRSRASRRSARSSPRAGRR